MASWSWKTTWREHRQTQRELADTTRVVRAGGIEPATFLVLRWSCCTSSLLMPPAMLPHCFYYNIAQFCKIFSHKICKTKLSGQTQREREKERETKIIFFKGINFFLIWYLKTDKQKTFCMTWCSPQTRDWDVINTLTSKRSARIKSKNSYDIRFSFLNVCDDAPWPICAPRPVAEVRQGGGGLI